MEVSEGVGTGAEGGLERTTVGDNVAGFYGEAAICEAQCLVGHGICVAGGCLGQDAADETGRCGD